MSNLTVAFVASLYEKEIHQPHYGAIIQLLERLGHTVLHRHLVDFDLQKVRTSDHHNARFHTSVLRAVKAADVIVAEITRQSIGVGYTLSEALKNQLPVLALTAADAPPVTTFLENHSLLSVHEYRNLEQLADDLPFLLSQLEPRKQKKFNVFLPFELDEYLVTASLKEHVSKSEYLRQLLEKDRNQHFTQSL